MSDLSFSIAALGLHPVKSCAALAPREALLTETGLDLDRAWAIVEASGGDVLTQRDLPRMALIRPTLRADDVVLRAPGMLALHLAIDAVDQACRATVWGDDVAACDMGPLAAQWCSDFLGRPCRLVRFDPGHRRVSDRAWTGSTESLVGFADAFALLVTSTASLAELNRRLAAAGAPAVGMERFRPNLVLDLDQPFDEDHVDELAIETGEGPVVLRLVKPCVRCQIPNIDPQTAESGPEPTVTLAGFRADTRMGGGLTFGMNAIVVEGVDRVLRVGQRGAATLKFD